MRHTKIIATLGPKTSDAGAIADLITAGVNVFRLNFSHGDHQTHGEVISRIRQAAAHASQPVAILQDLSGPKIRTGKLANGSFALAEGDPLTIAVGDFAGGPGRVSTSYGELARAVRAGDTLLLDDGRIQLEVQGSDGQEVKTRVVDGGVLGEHKGINAPGVSLPAAGLTAKDAADLRFGIGAGVDLVALSFVQSPDDLHAARAAASAAGAPDVPLIAKLERPEAIARLDDVLHASDGVMVARGDLGLEMPFEHVPQVQKQITQRARAIGIPVIVATQVLESMREEPRPTRAEVSDAANAVDDRVDAIMLAGETAVGKYPIRAVQTLDRIIRDAESVPPIATVPLEEAHMIAAHGRALCEAAVMLAERARADAIVAVTRAGHTAHVLSSLRPQAPIYAVTHDEAVSRRLSLWWGVTPLVASLDGEVSETTRRVSAGLLSRGILPRGSVVVVVSIARALADLPSNFLDLQQI